MGVGLTFDEGVKATPALVIEGHRFLGTIVRREGASASSSHAAEGTPQPLATSLNRLRSSTWAS